MNSITLLVLELLGGIILLGALVWVLSRAFKYDLFYDDKLGKKDEGADLTTKNNDKEDDDIIHFPSI